MTNYNNTTTIRRYQADADAGALTKLAQLDSTHAQTDADYLVAERNGELISAVRIDTMDVIADPFTHTAAISELMVTEVERMRGDPAVESVGLRHRLFHRPVLT